MIISNNIAKISFGNYIKSLQQGKFNVKQEYNDGHKLLLESFFNGNVLRQTIEHDSITGEILKSENFDTNGTWLSTQCFEYSSNKKVETFRSKSTNYIRTITTFIKDSIKYITEVYESSSDPARNYVYEIVMNAEEKILSWLCNGKKVM